MEPLKCFRTAWCINLLIIAIMMIQPSYQVEIVDEIVIRAVAKLHQKLDQMEIKQQQMVESLENLAATQVKITSEFSVLQQNMESCRKPLDSIMKTQDSVKAYLETNKELLKSSFMICPPGGFLLGAQCFILYADEALTWVAAKYKCQSQGNHLAQIRDEEASALRAYLHGKYAGQSRHLIWLGCKRGSDSVFRWHGGNGPETIASTSSLWIPGYRPNDHRGDCLEMNISNHAITVSPANPYAAVSCSNLNYALCEKTLE